jgi:hypothetical protein
VKRPPAFRSSFRITDLSSFVDDEDPSPAFAVHARIIRGMYGDANAENTYLKIADPDGGKTYDESSQHFTSKYEAMADATAWKLQMMHY